MAAAEMPFQKPGLPSFLVLGAVCATVLLGVALSQRGPDPQFSPIMAENPIVLPGGQAFYLQKYEVTVAEWNACHADGGCDLQLRAAQGRQEHELPATGLSYVDVQQYLAWINDRTNGSFRLPTITEWNYAARDVMPEKPDPLFTDPSLTWASAYLVENTTPRALKTKGQFSTSAEGVVDLDGSVWEWTQDCYTGQGEALNEEKCPAYYVAGEHEAVIPFLVRDPARGGCAVGSPPAHLGLRLVSDKPA